MHTHIRNESMYVLRVCICVRRCVHVLVCASVHMCKKACVCTRIYEIITTFLSLPSLLRDGQD